MKKIKLEEQKKIELEILKYVKKICEENNIKYFLVGGTLLGAVRHKGFIPWDDDIDIGMLYDDYIKFINIAKNNRDTKYRLFTPYDNESYYYMSSKMIDIETELIETR